MSEFVDLKVKGMTVEDILDVCLKCETKEDATKILKQFEEQCISPEVARTNLGYIFGCADDKGKKKLYSLFPVDHPFFGHRFGREDKDDRNNKK